MAARSDLGRNSTNLKMEDRFPAPLVAALRSVGHDVELIGDFLDSYGHAGAIVGHPFGLREGAIDTQADGIAM